MMSSVLSNSLPVAGLAMVAGVLGVGVGDLVTPDKAGPPRAIEVIQIEIFTDGSVYYEREIHPETAPMFWTGFVYDFNGVAICDGNGKWNYTRTSSTKITDKDAAWMTGDPECTPDKLKAGQEFIFTYSPQVRGQFQPEVYSGFVKNKESG